MSNVVRLNVGTGVPLRNATLQLHARRAAVPTYDRSTLSPGVVHIGIGNFHRAHQAVYFDELARGVSQQWGVTGVSLRHSHTADLLSAQDGLYTVVERSREGDTARVIGAIRSCHFAGRDSPAVLAALADERTRVVTLTVTGGGYYLDGGTGEFDCAAEDVRADLDAEDRFITAWAFLAEALDRRRRAGVAPFTVLSCDNLPESGEAARTALEGFAALRDPALARWIGRNVAFPSSVVDRICPKTDKGNRRFVERAFGISDTCPVVTEPYRQWIIEDAFCNERPPLDAVGAHFVSDVSRHKRFKTRLLNGTHCAIAYLGLLAGYEYVDEAMRDPVIGRYAEQLMRDEVGPLLPAVTGVNLDHYCRTLADRMRNPAIRDRLSRLAARGSVKMPGYLLPSLREAIAYGRPHTLLTLAVAGWIRYLRGYHLDGRKIRIDDPEVRTLNALATIGGNDPGPLLRNHDALGELRSAPEFESLLGRLVVEIDTRGVAATLRRHVTGHVQELVAQ